MRSAAAPSAAAITPTASISSMGRSLSRIESSRVSRKRRIVAGAVLVVAGAIASAGPPRLTLTNAGLSVEYPWFRGAGALVAAAGAALLASAFRKRWPRVAAGALAALGLAVATHLLAYRLEADAAGISSQGIGARRTVAWPAVSRVEGGPGAIVVVGADQTRIEIDTTDFRPEQRASLERTIARRIKDSSAAR